MSEHNIPSLIPLRTLSSSSGAGNRAWQSIPHPSDTNPLLATAVADKSINIWSLRDFTLVSSITGGHKRSVRTVDWKDYGSNKKRKTDDAQKPVTLATGSFDANVGIWVRNDAFEERNQGGNTTENVGESAVEDDDDNNEMDFSRAMNRAASGSQDGDDDDEEWHFSTLLTGPDSEIKSVAFSPAHYGANLLATSSRDKSVWVWEEVEKDEWETIAVLGDHTGDVKCVAWCEGAPTRRPGTRSDRTNPTGMDLGDTDGIEEDERIVGSREILASGSYDDTVRLWRDVEEEGDWMCVGVIDGHSGTVWGVTWEKYINYDLVEQSPSKRSQLENEWEPRLLSCSDDLTIRVWRRELSEAELEKRRAQGHQTSNVNGNQGSSSFMNQRLPSIIRPSTVYERWSEDATLPKIHLRSVYAIDWSRRTGLVVSCGGDGNIAVYRESAISAGDRPQNESQNGTTSKADVDDTVMNDAEDAEMPETEETFKARLEWTIVALIEAAHDEYEINHVCWALRKDRKDDISASEEDFVSDEEVIISTGDDGDVKIWRLPDEVRSVIYS